MEELNSEINLVWANKKEYMTTIFNPLGIGYIAAYLLKKNFNVKIQDLTFSEKINIDNTRKIYGISMPTPLYNFSMEVIKKIKEKNKNNIVIVGGPHANCLPEELIKNKNIDYVVLGEGEETFFELCKNLINKKQIKKIKGIYYKDKNGIHFTGQRNFIKNLDNLPFPRHDLFSLEKYDENKAIKEMLIIASRGCPFNCEFCQPYLRNIFGAKIRYRSPKNVIDEMEHLKKRYNAQIIAFADDMVNPDYTKKICNEIIKRKLKILWRCQARANLTKEILKLMKKAGCIGISFGVESGSQKVLDSIQKNLKIKDIKKVFKSCREVGIFTHAFIMIGNSNENMKDVFKTSKLIKEIKPFSIGVAITTPYPKTHLFERLKKENKIPKKLDWGKFHHIMDNTTHIKISELSNKEIIMGKHMLIEKFEKENKISRLGYILLYIKDFSGISNIFNFIIRSLRSSLKAFLTLISISKSGSGYKLTNPKIKMKKDK